MFKFINIGGRGHSKTLETTKRLIRTISLRKYDNILGLNEYIVVYSGNRGYDLLSEYELKELLLHPKKDKDIQYIFKWEDRLYIESKFEERGENDEGKVEKNS